MQRGLRINPTAQNLWLQYFRLEFSYIKKLMGRREVLGLDGGGGGGEGDVRGQRGGMDIPLLEGEGAGQNNAGPSFEAVQEAEAAAAAGDAEGDSVRPAPVMNDTARRFYKGAVPLAVFRAALKAIPEDVEFRAGFLRCCALDFPDVGREVAEAILGSIAQDFPENCEAWEVRASYPLLVVEGGGTVGAGGVAGSEGWRGAGWGVEGKGLGLGPAMQECIGTFELAVEAIGARDPAMWVRYASFLKRRLEPDDGGGVGGNKKRKGPGGGGSAGASAKGGGPSAHVAAALLLLLQRVLTRAVEIHLGASSESPAIAKVAADAAAGKQAALSTAVGGDAGADGAAMESVDEDAEDAREALSAGLSDVCLAAGKPDSALEALCVATAVLPSRPGPWIRRAALERRMHALGEFSWGGRGVV